MLRTDAAETNKDSVIQLLEAMPSCTSLAETDVRGRKNVVLQMNQLISVETSVLRASLSEFIKNKSKNQTLGAVEGMLFILNRYVFDVPVEMERKAIKIIPGFLGIPQHDGRVNMMWPLSIGTDNRIAFGYQFGGSYLGEAYDALAEFDRFEAQFGRRKFEAGTKDADQPSKIAAKHDGIEKK
jgi:hypothetical protein